MKNIDKENQSNIFRKLDEFDMSIRLSNLLKEQNLLYVGDLAILQRHQLLRFPNIGKTTIKEIDSLLNSLGLYLGMNIPDWPPDAEVDKVLNENINFKIHRPIDTYPEKSKKLTDIKNYNLHKDNRLLFYLSKDLFNSLTRIENVLNKNVCIKDIAEKKIDFDDLKLKKSIGRKSIFLLEHYNNFENLEELILSRPDLSRKNLIEINSEEIEKMILEDIEDLRNNFNKRNKIIFDCQFGYKRDILTLEKTAEEVSKNENIRLTRERIRQIASRIKRQISHKNPRNNFKIKKYLEEKQGEGFHKLFPKLDEVFTDTDLHNSKDIKQDRLTTFLECYCGVKEGSFVTPERELKGNFNPGQLEEIFSEVPSPIEIADFNQDVQEIFGYNLDMASEAIKFMNENNLIKIYKDKVYPIKMTKHNEAAHILLKFPNGLFWKDVYLIMNESFTANSHNLNRPTPGMELNRNESLYLSDKGTYKHIKFLEVKSNADEICKNTLSVLKGKNSKSMKLIHVHNIIKKNNVKPSCNIGYFNLRAIIRDYGSKHGIFFKGRSSVDSVSLEKDFKYLTGKDNIYNIIKNSEKAIHEDDIFRLIKRSKEQNQGMLISMWAEQLLSEEKVMRVGPKLWYETNKGLQMCNISILLENLMKLFDKYEVVSVNYFTKYINQKMNLAFSYYYYDSIFKIFSTKKDLFYSNNYLCKKKIDIGTKIIYQKYFHKDLSLGENVKRVDNLGIAVLKTQFLNSAYYYSK